MSTVALAWVKEEPFGVEFAEVELGDEALAATGVAVGADPVPYRLDYRLETGPEFVTARLHVVSRGQGWQRRLDLRRTPAGTWEAEALAQGEGPVGPPGGELAPLQGALDCDLGLSPLTNTMPVLRHRLLSGGGPVQLRMAWVSVPDLSVHPSGQRYTFLRAGDGRSLVRFEAMDGGFAADILFDAQGLVVDYPGIGRRL